MSKLRLNLVTGLLLAGAYTFALANGFDRAQSNGTSGDPVKVIPVTTPTGETAPKRDSANLLEIIRSKNQFDYQITKEHFERLAQVLQDRKTQNAEPLIERGRGLLDQAHQLLSSEKAVPIRPILDQVQGVILEMNRLVENGAVLENHSIPGSGQEPHLSTQPAQKSALIQATEMYNRVHDRVSRLSDQKETKLDPRSTAVFNRILDMQDRCREALANGQADAAKDLALKSDALISEWHRGSASVGIANSGAQNSSELERLKVKINRATEIVASSKNEKASRILEKGLEHFERATTAQRESQDARAKIEMDIALKLAAKAVDIARSGQNH